MPASNRSLERGLSILDCFRPGLHALTHGDIAAATGLPKATLTRLLGTLVAHGYLCFDPAARAYGLGPPCLSLAWTLTRGSRLHERIAPAVRQLAQRTQSIIGFGTEHQGDIVYLVAHNGDPARPHRVVGTGMRAPLLTTSVGRAWLAARSAGERRARLAQLRRDGALPPALRTELRTAFEHFDREGCCLVARDEGRQVAAGIALPVPGAPLHAAGCGYRLPAGTDPERVPVRILDALAQLREAVALAAAEPD